MSALEINRDGDEGKDSAELSAHGSSAGSPNAMEIRKAIRQRTHVGMKLYRIKQMLSEDAPSSTLAQLTVLSKTIPTVYAEYSQFHTKIIALVAEDALRREEETYAKFEEMYYNVFCTVEEKLLIAHSCKNANGQKSSLTPDRPTQNRASNFVLTDWTNQNAIKAVQYLINNWGNEEVLKALLGNDDEVVLPTSSCQERYKEVSGVLMGSANEKRVLVETHIRGMANLRKMETDSKEELVVLLNEVTRHVDSLYYLEQAVTGVTEQFVVNLISSALSDSIRRSWENSRTFSELCSLPEMIKFLRSHYNPARKPLQPRKQYVPKPFSVITFH